MTVPNNANTYLPGVVAIPSSLNIIAITQSNPMVITVTVNMITEANTYIVGQLIRLTIPRPYGMTQADQLTAQILAIDDSTISVNIDSTLFDPFALPPSGEQPASLAPAGSRNLQFDNSTDKIPFQSLNNVGN